QPGQSAKPSQLSSMPLSHSSGAPQPTFAALSSQSPCRGVRPSPSSSASQLGRSTTESQSSSSKLQSSTGTGPHSPHALVTPSSICPSQLSSRPLQISAGSGSHSLQLLRSRFPV